VNAASIKSRPLLHLTTPRGSQRSPLHCKGRQTGRQAQAGCRTATQRVRAQEPLAASASVSPSLFHIQLAGPLPPIHAPDLSLADHSPPRLIRAGPPSLLTSHPETQPPPTGDTSAYRDMRDVTSTQQNRNESPAPSPEPMSSFPLTLCRGVRNRGREREREHVRQRDVACSAMPCHATPCHAMGQGPSAIIQPLGDHRPVPSA
jgi:hypothetical protein